MSKKEHLILYTTLIIDLFMRFLIHYVVDFPNEDIVVWLLDLCTLIIVWRAIAITFGWFHRK